MHTAHAQGFSLIIVPCWWDGSPESLVSTIRCQRPDLLTHWPSSSFPISFNPPIQLLSPEIPGVGELMIASFPRDVLFPYTNSYWWMGEKYDGVRCCWNASEKQLYSRAGNKIMLEPQFCNNFPLYTFLDAEIWMGKRNFYEAQRMCSGGLVQWDSLRINAFDVPSFPFQRLPFETRYSHLLQSIPPNMKIVAPRLKITRMSILEALVNQTLENEGEGLILRKPLSFYENGRSKSLIKLKGSTEDKEGIVIEKSLDKSVVLKLANGTIFSVPHQNIHLFKIEIGDVVTFSFKKGEEYANVIIYQIRTDISWPEVIQNDLNNNNNNNNNDTIDESINNEKSIKSSNNNNNKSRTKRTWTESTMRMYLEKVAKERNMDPLLPQTWYNISPASIHKTEKGANVLAYFRGGYVGALKKLFPDIGLNFTDLGSHFSLLRLKDFSNRRQFCENYARAHGFDPYNPDHWYQQSKDQFLSFKGANTMLRYYRGNLPKALISIFPDIGLQRSLLYALLNFTPQYANVLSKYKNKKM